MNDDRDVQIKIAISGCLLKKSLQIAKIKNASKQCVVTVKLIVIYILTKV